MEGVGGRFSPSWQRDFVAADKRHSHPCSKCLNQERSGYYS